MVTRRSARASLCLFFLLATWVLTWHYVASQMRQGSPAQARPVSLGYAAHSRRAAHSFHALIDDGLTYFSAALRTVEVLPFSAILLTFILVTLPVPAKDLLSFTQRRRE